MELSQKDIASFKRGEYENPIFWSRLGKKPALQGVSILDVGCGWGSLCIDMALAGAKKVVGLDINTHLIDFANQNLKQNYPDLVHVVIFKAMDLRNCADDQFVFGYIVSKDAFEHIIDLPTMLTAMKKHLKPGGRIYAGFGPLYPSPYGDHDRRRTTFKPWGLWGRFLALIPWGHLPLESTIINTRNRYRQEKVNSMYDLGLNKMSLSDYRCLFHTSGLSIIDFRVNQSTGIHSKIFSLPRQVPFLEDYCTHNIYCILEKDRE